MLLKQLNIGMLKEDQQGILNGEIPVFIYVGLMLMKLLNIAIVIPLYIY